MADEPTASGGEDPGQVTRIAEERLSPGQTLGSYKIIESIGKGGMGEVGWLPSARSS